VDTVAVDTVAVDTAAVDTAAVETIVVCDTEPVAIEGLRGLLERMGGLRVVAAETSLIDGMDAVRELQPGLLIVDKAFGVHAITDWLATWRPSCP
jgi:DNA-binding NarL/FixJ family response regulator